MINPNARMLTNALRSGDYGWGVSRYLCHYDREGYKLYTCLGVACDLYQKAVGDLKVVYLYERAPDGHIFSYLSYSGSLYELPEKVRVWLGLQTHNGDYGFIVKDSTRVFSLARSREFGLSFRPLADIIESKPMGLFE